MISLLTPRHQYRSLKGMRPFPDHYRVLGHGYDLYAAAEKQLLAADQTMTSFVGSPTFAAPEVLR